MKKDLSLALGLLMMFAVSAEAAVAVVKPFEELQGSDWKRLSTDEKQRFIYTGIGGLESRGVFVMRSPEEYLQAMDQVLAADPDFADEYLENVFVFCVYDAEPQTRDELDKIRANEETKGA